jgi:hypothetical protein
MSTYANVVRQNQEKIDDAAWRNLGIYVYALQDPDTKRIFYVGKGGGGINNSSTDSPEQKTTDGNNRVLAHFREAEHWLNAPLANRIMPDKVKSILDVWARGQAVDWFIVRRRLRDADEAHHVESALIDILPVSSNGFLDNIQGGHHTAIHGILLPSGVAEYNIPLVNPDRPFSRVLVFPIQSALNQNRSPYDAVRSYWETSAATRDVSPEKPCWAVGLANGISQVVVKIEEWTAVPNVPDRWEFVGSTESDSLLMKRNFSVVLAQAMGYWMRGNYLGVQFDGEERFRFFRGSKDKIQYHDCIPPRER